MAKAYHAGGDGNAGLLAIGSEPVRGSATSDGLSGNKLRCHRKRSQTTQRAGRRQAMLIEMLQFARRTTDGGDHRCNRLAGTTARGAQCRGPAARSWG